MALAQNQPGDELDINKFNALPGPVTAILFGGDEFWIETLDVSTGCMRLDVSGAIQLGHFDSVNKLRDINGNEFDADDFYLE